jgi:hypothetical protein
MIPIRRGQEPESLRDARWWRVARACLHLRQHNDLKDFKFTDYDVDPVKATLYERQFGKCAYCEQWRELTGSPIEHIRPKKGAIRAPKLVDELCYWWLAWTWENLCFSCSTCNESPYKLNHYPLAPGAAPLDQHAPFDSAEDALLIDPSRSHHAPAQPHPMDHIQFVQVSGSWRPSPRDNSPYGELTIRLLGLGRDDLLTRYNDHMERHKERLARLRQEAINDLPTLRNTWASIVPELLGHPKDHWVNQPFAALVWDAIDQIVPAPQRAKHKLPFPRPGERLRPDPSCEPFVEEARQQGFAHDTIWHIRAIGRRGVAGFDERLSLALLTLLEDDAYRPRDVSQLHALIHEPTLSANFEQANPADIQTALDALLAQRRVIRDPADLWSLAPPTP